MLDNSYLHMLQNEETFVETSYQLFSGRGASSKNEQMPPK